MELNQRITDPKTVALPLGYTSILYKIEQWFPILKINISHSILNIKIKSGSK